MKKIVFIKAEIESDNADIEDKQQILKLLDKVDTLTILKIDIYNEK